MVAVFEIRGERVTGGRFGLLPVVDKDLAAIEVVGPFRLEARCRWWRGSEGFAASAAELKLRKELHGSLLDLGRVGRDTREGLFANLAPHCAPPVAVLLLPLLEVGSRKSATLGFHVVLAVAFEVGVLEFFDAGDDFGVPFPLEGERAKEDGGEDSELDLDGGRVRLKEGRGRERARESKEGKKGRRGRDEATEEILRGRG